MSQQGKVAVFISGRGSNLAALIRAQNKPEANFRIVLVVSDNPQAPGLARAKKAGIKCHAWQRQDYFSREEFEKGVLPLIKAEAVELICLAGYMRLIGPLLLQKYAGRIMNIHPSLLPAFPGLKAQSKALRHGVKYSGCTVHFVDAGLDSGPIIMQKPVAVHPDDNTEKLASRILRQEHRLFPAAVRLFFCKRLSVANGRVVIKEP